MRLPAAGLCAMSLAPQACADEAGAARPNSLWQNSHRTAYEQPRLSRFGVLQSRDRKGVGFAMGC